MQPELIAEVLSKEFAYGSYFSFHSDIDYSYYWYNSDTIVMSHSVTIVKWMRETFDADDFFVNERILKVIVPANIFSMVVLKFGVGYEYTDIKTVA